MSKGLVKIESSLYWWLSRGRPFMIGDEYKLELVAIDTNNMTAKILITNLKTQEVSEQVLENV